MKGVILGLVITAITGCTNHYYVMQGNQVSLLLKKNAHEVYFASSLDQYRLHSAQKDTNDYWRIEVPGIQTFRYFYLVDGEFYIPDCRFKEYDDFGTQNCIFMPFEPDGVSHSNLTPE